jgi:hypothetical protein
MDNAEMKKYESKFKNTSARAQCKSLVNAVVLYIRDTGVEPEQTDFIDKLLQDDGPWRSYLESNCKFIDPWGSEYVLGIEDDMVWVSSRGSDGLLNTGDDVREEKEKE